MVHVHVCHFVRRPFTVAVDIMGATLTYISLQLELGIILGGLALPIR